MVQTVEHEGIRLEVRSRAVTFVRTEGLEGAGRGVGWASAETTCRVSWVAEAESAGARLVVARGDLPGGDDCAATATRTTLPTCAAKGRLALYDGRFHQTVFRLDGSLAMASLWLGDDGENCKTALADPWDEATLLAHGRVVGGLDRLLRGGHAEATVRAFLDNDTPDAGTSLARPSVLDNVDEPEDEAPDAHGRFLRGVRRGAARTPDLEAALYAFLTPGPRKEAFDPGWSTDHLARALSVTPSRERRTAYLLAAIAACAALANDALRTSALQEALAQGEDGELTRRAKLACPKLVVSDRPLYPWLPGR